jgi:hypothetical protein
MINQEQVIPCPVCQTKIPFDSMQLMQGAQYACPNEQCDAVIGLAQESKPMVEEAMQKFNEMKSNLGKEQK